MTVGFEHSVIADGRVDDALPLASCVPSKLECHPPVNLSLFPHPISLSTDWLLRLRSGRTNSVRVHIHFCPLPRSPMGVCSNTHSVIFHGRLSDNLPSSPSHISPLHPINLSYRLSITLLHRSHSVRNSTSHPFTSLSH